MLFVDKKRSAPAFPQVRRPFRWMLCLLILYFIGCVAALATSSGQLAVYLDVPPGCVGQPDIRMNGTPIELRGVENMPNGRLKVTVRGLEPGRTEITMCWPQQQNVDQFLTFKTGRLRLSIENGSLNFPGCQGILILTVIMLMLMTLIVALHFSWRLKNDFYSYRTAFTGGMAFFAVSVSLLFLYVSRDWWTKNPESSIYSILSYFSGSSYQFMFSTAPVLFVICLGLIASNLSLVRHEGLRPANLMAAAAALLVILGFLGAVAFDETFTSGSIEEFRLHACLTTAVTSCFAFMEAMLLGTMLCGLIAAKREPDYDRDFVIIHGCQIAKDGSPLPLLRGRIDRALAFARQQRDATGKELIFIPSGGQGADECISEGQCIADYLKKQGVSPEQMLVEDRSASTLENMAFSKSLIDRNKKDAKVAFSTTNYHVFRSGVLAKKAGLDAQGMGGETKWYFWPNAFIREFIALLDTEKRAMAPLLIAMVAFFVALTYFSIQ